MGFKKKACQGQKLHFGYFFTRTVWKKKSTGKKGTLRMAEVLSDAGEDPTAVMMSPRQRAMETTFSLKCLKDKLIPIGATVLLTALLIAIIALAARKCPSCPSPILPTCSGNGIRFGEKCFYFVEDEANWNESQSFCLSQGVQLATIDSQENLVK